MKLLVLVLILLLTILLVEAPDEAFNKGPHRVQESISPDTIFDIDNQHCGILEEKNIQFYLCVYKEREGEGGSNHSIGKCKYRKLELAQASFEDL